MCLGKRYSGSSYSLRYSGGKKTNYAETLLSWNTSSPVLSFNGFRTIILRTVSVKSDLWVSLSCFHSVVHIPSKYYARHTLNSWFSHPY